MFLQLPSRVSTFDQYHLKYRAILTNLKTRNPTRANATLTDPKALTLTDPKRRHAAL